MHILFIIILATIIVSLGSFVGFFSFLLKPEKLEKFLIFPVSLSTGALLGGAFIHLLPEASEKLGDIDLFKIVLFSIVIFFLIEKILHWHHCHKGVCEAHTYVHMSLLGDAVHNFIDGLIIASTFIIDVKLGIVTTVAIALHEIPQEIGDFAVLLYGGFSRKKALLANIFIALTSIIGGVSGYFMASLFQNLIIYIVPFAAGGFIYIAVSDLMPEVRSESNILRSFLSFAAILGGIFIVQIFTLIK